LLTSVEGNFVHCSESYLFGFHRETNKAFCGFLDQSKCDHKRLFQDGGLKGSQCIQAGKDDDVMVKDFPV
jgi:hypothetical protein